MSSRLITIYIVGGINRMKILIINTHPGPNPLFLDGLLNHLASLHIRPPVMGAYDGEQPLHHQPDRIILTGVPLDADYSLSEPATQRLVQRTFGWLHGAKCPVLGICYGHQIIAHIFGGQVASLKRPVEEPRHPLYLINKGDVGIFAGFDKIEVFAEHRDYVSSVPPGFKVLTRNSPIPYIIYHPKLHIYGIQFVPELSDTGTQKILQRFLS